jgi:hypothetical protein
MELDLCQRYYQQIDHVGGRIAAAGATEMEFTHTLLKKMRPTPTVLDYTVGAGTVTSVVATTTGVRVFGTASATGELHVTGLKLSTR